MVATRSQPICSHTSNGPATASLPPEAVFDHRVHVLGGRYAILNEGEGLAEHRILQAVANETQYLAIDEGRALADSQ